MFYATEMKNDENGTRKAQKRERKNKLALKKRHDDATARFSKKNINPEKMRKGAAA